MIIDKIPISLRKGVIIEALLCSQNVHFTSDLHRSAINFK